MAWATRLREQTRRRLASILTRFLLINLIVMAVPIAGIWFARLHERQLLQGLERDMIHQAQVLRESLLAADPVNLRGHGPLLARISEHTGLRIRLVSPDGRVRSDSGGKPIDVGTRAEVQTALEGRYGANTRFAPHRARLNIFAALPISHEGSVIGVIYASRSSAEVTRSMLYLRRQLIRIFYISLAITIVMTLFLATTISRPLGRLAARADKIANGNTVLALKVNGSSEIGELARAFERMRLRLQERGDETAQMAADISHEFKSPLTSIRGAAELLLDGAAQDEKVRTRFLKNIADDSERMSRLVGRLLELSRLQADSSRPQTLDLARLVRRLCESRPSAIAEFSGGCLEIVGRIAILETAIVNLLDNAQQHAEAGSQVRVKLLRVHDGVRLLVTNRGQMISQRNLERMWQRFFTTRVESGGSGLGLAIVHSVVEMHGGAVEANSAQHETAIGFWLPAG